MTFSKELFAQFSEFIEKVEPIIHKELVVKWGFIKQPIKRNLYAWLVGAVIGQKIRFSKARSLRGKLYLKLGTDDFSADDVMKLEKPGLIELGIEDWQADIIIRVTNFIQKNLNNQLTINNCDELLTIKGIGEWTLNNVKLMWSLGSGSDEVFDKLMVKDLIIRRGLKKLFNATKKHEFDQLSVKWSPYNGIITWYLWKEFT